MERGNLIFPPCAMQGRHYRKACCWNGGIEGQTNFSSTLKMYVIERGTVKEKKGPRIDLIKTLQLAFLHLL